MIHELKIKPQYYEDIKIGLKPFEIRKNDRDFKLGDILILNDPEYCKEGYVILGIIPVGERHG